MSLQRSSRRAKPVEPESEGLAMRVMAAVVAVPIVEVSLFLGIFILSGHWRGAARHYAALPLLFHVVLVGSTVALSLVFGFRGLTQWLGHLFYTHFEAERDGRLTALYWAIIVGTWAAAHAVAS